MSGPEKARGPGRAAGASDPDETFAETCAPFGDARLSSGRPVNLHAAAHAVPFDYAVVEAGDNPSDVAADMRRIGIDGGDPLETFGCIADAHPDAAEFLERLTLIACRDSNRQPIGRALGISFVAACFVLGVSCLRKETLRSLSVQIGMTHEGFRRYVKAWCDVLGMPPPNHKPAITRERELAARKRRNAREAA